MTKIKKKLAVELYSRGRTVHHQRYRFSYRDIKHNICNMWIVEYGSLMSPRFKVLGRHEVVELWMRKPTTR